MAKKKEEPAASPLDRAVQEVRAKWGVGSIHVPHEELKFDREVLSTGITQLDDILGNGGIVRGSIVEIFGKEGSGKSSMSLQLIAQAQKCGLKTVFIDQEHSLSVEYAKSLGVDTEELYIAQPDSLEMSFGIIEALVRTGEIGLVVVDSLASMVPIAEVEEEVGKDTMGLQARKMSAELRRFNPIVAKTQTILLFTNQLRDNIGSYGGGSTTPGGKAVKYYSSYRLEVKVAKKVTDSSGAVIGNNLLITAVKNRYHHPYRAANLTLLFGEGVDIIGSIIDDAYSVGALVKSHNWFEFPEGVIEGAPTEKFNGKNSMRAYLIDNPDILDKLNKVLEEMSL